MTIELSIEALMESDLTPLLAALRSLGGPSD
jgi:hypothetical protein